MQEYSPLLAAIGTQHEVHETSPGVWTHTFTASSAPTPLAYTISTPLAPYVQRLVLESSIPIGQIVYPGRLPISLQQDQARIARLMRRKQIARRQNRAAFRRRKRGLA